MNNQQFASAVLNEIAKKDHSLVEGHDEGSSGIWTPETPLQIDARSLKSLLFTEDWVYIVVNRMALRISGQKLKVFRKEVVKGKTLRFPAEDHPTQARLDDPNRMQDVHNWTYNIATDLIHMGNSVIWDARSIDVLQPIFAETVSLFFNEQTGTLEKYIVHDQREDTALPFLEFDPSSIIHIKRPNPSSFFWGLSPFIPGRSAVLFNKFTSEFLNNYYVKGATPSLKVEMDKDVNEKSALRMLRSFQQANSGRRNQHAPLLLPKGVKASAISTTIADQQLSLIVNQNRETIINLLGIPKHELSLQAAGSLGSQEARIAQKNFWLTSLIPLMKLIEGAFNKAFADELGTNHEIKFDLSDVEELKDDQIKKAELAEKLLKTHTINEVRQTLYDREPHPDGDGLLSVNSQPFAQVIEDPSIPPSEFSPEDQKKLEDRVTKLASYLDHRKLWWSDYQKQFDRINDRDETQFEALTLGLYLRLIEDALPQIRRSLKDTKSSTKTELNDKRKLRKRLQRIIGQFKQEWLTEYTDIANRTMDFGFDATVQTLFDTQNELAVMSIAEREENKRRSLLEARGIRSFSMIQDSETEQIMATIERGIKENKTVDEITADIGKKFRDPQNVGFRAQRIARTETATAMMLGKRAAMQNASRVVPGLQKVWLNANDLRVRGHPVGSKTKADHWRLQGETVGVNERFSNGLKHPLDADAGQPEEVINCRCDVLLIPPGEAFAGVGTGLVGS